MIVVCAMTPNGVSCGPPQSVMPFVSFEECKAASPQAFAHGMTYLRDQGHQGMVRVGCAMMKEDGPKVP